MNEQKNVKFEELISLETELLSCLATSPVSPLFTRKVDKNSESSTHYTAVYLVSHHIPWTSSMAARATTRIVAIPLWQPWQRP